jgi:hypothetical protein
VNAAASVGSETADSGSDCRGSANGCESREFGPSWTSAHNWKERLTWRKPVLVGKRWTTAAGRGRGSTFDAADRDSPSQNTDPLLIRVSRVS